MASRDALAASDPTRPRRVLILGAAPAQLPDIAGLAEILAQAAARDHGVVVSAEEHNVTSGFGSAVAEVLAAQGAGARLVRIGMPDQFSIPGPPTHLYRHYGLNAEGVAAVVRSALQA